MGILCSTLIPSVVLHWFPANEAVDVYLRYQSDYTDKPANRLNLLFMRMKPNISTYLDEPWKPQFHPNPLHLNSNLNFTALEEHKRS